MKGVREGEGREEQREREERGEEGRERKRGERGGRAGGKEKSSTLEGNGKNTLRQSLQQPHCLGHSFV